MVGRELDQMYPARQAEIGEDVLEVKHLGRLGKFKDVSFHVRKGEVVALTGLVGAGRTEVCESLFGIVPANPSRFAPRGTPSPAALVFSRKIVSGRGCLKTTRSIRTFPRQT